MSTYVHTNANTSYNIRTKQLLLPTGAVTSPVVKQTETKDGYLASVTASGNTYITVHPTYFDPEWLKKWLKK